MEPINTLIQPETQERVPVGPAFRVLTIGNRTLVFRTNSEHMQKEWVEAIRSGAGRNEESKKTAQLLLSTQR